MNNKDAVKTNVLLLVIFMLIVISAAVFFNLKNGLGGGSDVVISGGYMTDGVDAWNNFVQKTSSNKKAFVRIKFKSKNGVSKAVLKYKNGKYYYTYANGKEYYRVSVTYHGKHISLGSFNAKRQAASCYKEAKDILNGSYTPDDYPAFKAISFDKFIFE